MDEHSFQKAFKAELEKWNVHCPSLVASMFMAGMPDMLLNNKLGYTFYIENKFWRNSNPPKDAHAIQNLLKGPQIAVIKHTLWKRGIMCPIVAQIENDPDMAAICYKDMMKIYPWREFAKFLANINGISQFLDLMSK